MQQNFPEIARGEKEKCMAGQYEAKRRKKRRPEQPEQQQQQEPQERQPRPPRKRRRRRVNPFRVLLVILLALLLVAIIGACAARSYYYGEIEGSRRPEGEIEVEIPQGAGTAQIASILKEEGVIGSSYLFRYYSRKAEADGSYQYGVFTLDPREGYDGIIRRLQEVQHRLESVTVTFPEGYNAFQIGDVLEEAGLCTREEFLDAIQNHSFDVDFIREVSDDPLKLIRLEGFLFPDTYEFYTDEEVDSIVLRMLENFKSRVLTQENREALEKSGYTLDQWAALSSIIQKESFGTEDIYNVSSVFANRLAEDSPYPKLESNTTSDFINAWLTPFTNGEPSQEMVTAYDTYEREGLPVGAICNPGAEAFTAALHPERNDLDGDYYFFVTDVEYNYYYGRNFEEHSYNIQKAIAVNAGYGIQGLVQ